MRPDMDRRTVTEQALGARLGWQAYAAFLIALIRVAPIFVAGLVSVLFLLVANVLFYGGSKFEWKLSIEISATLSLIWFLVLFVSTLADTWGDDVREKKRSPIFPASAFFRGLYGGGSVLFLMMLRGMYKEGDSLRLELIPLAFLVLAWVSWPRTIRFSPDALSQRTLFGRKQRLEFRDIETISFSRSEDRTTVFGGDIEIVHTGQHAGKPQFHELLAERTGKEVYGA